MSNMSYCRFRNTLADFRDCSLALDDMIDGGDEDDTSLSADEQQALHTLVSEAIGFINKIADWANVEIDLGDMDDPRRLKDIVDKATIREG